MNTDYLSKEHLVGFEHYKYSSIDTNPLSKYILHPFWNFVVLYVPRWVAPNLLTFLGFLLTIAAYVVLSYYDYFYLASSDDFPGFLPIPNWVWLFTAVSHFLAYTLDGIDGKQARRTGTSGPLGELFDHGLDSWTNFFIPVTLYSMFGCADFSIPCSRYYWIIFSVHCIFLASHWEKYNTGVLYLPWGYDFSEIILTFTYLLTWMTDFRIWKGFVPWLNVTPAFIMEMILFSGAFLVSLPVSLYNVYNSYRFSTGHNRSFLECIRPLVSFFCLYVLTTIWAFKSPTDILHIDPRCFFFLLGITFSSNCTRLIIAQMSNTRCELLNWMLFPLLVVVVALLYIPAAAAWELTALRVLTAVFTVAHIHYGYNVVRQMCVHFKIMCFTIKKQTNNKK